MNYGFSGVNKSFNSRQSNNATLLSISNLDDLIVAARVKYILLDDSDKIKFEKYGGWNALGLIEYELVNSPNLKIEGGSIAYPLNPNIKSFPLLEEIVYIITLPKTSIGISNTAVRQYYVNNVSLWNHPHHNAYPTRPNELPPTQQKDYIQTQAGSVRRITDQSTEIFLGKTFKERANIHPLLPFEGDIIYEGRWGNSIRLGSTVKFTSNNWSNTGTDGDPITIIRNGQGNQNEEGWIPTVEDINNDDSSIYLTSTQKVPLEVSSTSYDSYRTPPTAPDQYAGKQIIINSGRLVFNSTVDHILLSSATTIGLNAVKGFNFDTKANFVVNAPSIKLGSKNATEPLLLGNQTINLLNQLITNLSGFMTICSTAVSTPPGTPLVQLNVAAAQVNTSLQALQANLETLKSKYNYTV